MTRGAIRLALLLAAVSAGLYVAGSWHSGNLMDAEEAAGHLREGYRGSDSQAALNSDKVGPLSTVYERDVIPVLAAPSAPIIKPYTRERVAGSVARPQKDGKAHREQVPSPFMLYIISPPEWLCLSQRVQRGRVELRRFAIAHQRESDHEWELQCAYGPAFPRGGI